MADMRTFIAFDISPAVRDVCRRHIERLRRSFRDVRVGWERPEKLHITLKFLGTTEVSVLPELEKKFEKVTGMLAPLTLRLSDPGVFPSISRPRVLWIGVDEDVNDATVQLQEAVESVCAELGFAKERRPFHPHLTMGRIRDPNRAISLAEEHMRSEIEPVEFEVAEFVLYESKLQPTGSVYSPLFSVNLRG